MQKPRINNQIRAEQLRIIDENGQQLGIFSLNEAKQQAQEAGLDLIEIAPQAKPPVAKIIDYGKFLYQEAKKERVSKGHQKKGGETKGIRIHVKTSPHDLELKLSQAEKFFAEGNRVRVEMFLRGREKAHRDFAKVKFENFLKVMVEKGCKLEQEIRPQPFGFTAVVSKQ